MEIIVKVSILVLNVVSRSYFKKLKVQVKLISKYVLIFLYLVGSCVQVLRKSDKFAERSNRIKKEHNFHVLGGAPTLLQVLNHVFKGTI